LSEGVADCFAGFAMSRLGAQQVASTHVLADAKDVFWMFGDKPFNPSTAIGNAPMLNDLSEGVHGSPAGRPAARHGNAAKPSD
jgi:hypothetical protein